MAIAAPKKSLLVLTCLALACSSDPVPVPYTTLPVARCGMKPYSLIDPATLGELVTYEETDTFNLDAAGVNALLQSTGFKGAPVVPYGTRVFRYRYTTQDRGQKIEATAVLGIPANEELPDVEFPAMITLHGTTGFSDACAPGRSANGGGFAALMGAMGYIAVQPDYIGLNSFGAASTTTHGYLVAEQVAIGSWDALRAGRKLVEKLHVGLKVSTKTVIWGGSQGGHAALFVDRYAPYYAPEFEVPAVVALVAPTVLAPILDAAVTKYSPPSVSFGAVFATMREWYGQPANLSGVLTDQEPYRFASTIKDQVLVKGDDCNTGEAYKPIDDHPEEQRVDIMYEQSFVDAVKQNRWSDLEPWNCFLKENSLGTTSVQAKRQTPTLMIYSAQDDLVVTAPMRDEFTRLCGQGYQFDYKECQGAGHADGAIWSLPEQFDWIRARLEGQPLAADACQVKAPVCCSATPDGKCTSP